MTPAQFLTRMERGEIASAYLFLGPEAYQRRRARAALLKAALGAAGPENAVTQYDLAETPLSEAIDDARALMIEGGNPIGAEASMLIECLAHVGRCRGTIERDLETKWLAIAAALLPMVQENLAEAFERLRPMPADHVARGGQYR